MAARLRLSSWLACQMSQLSLSDWMSESALSRKPSTWRRSSTTSTSSRMKLERDSSSIWRN
jgi:hypothetical protein